MQKLMIAAGASLVALSIAAGAYAAPTKQRTAISLQCSKQADAKGLHGKERKAFREKCKHEAEHAAGTTKMDSKKMKSYRSTDKSGASPN
jgi:hypothetical protein